MGAQKNPMITDSNMFLKTLNSEISTAEGEVTHINPHSKLSFQIKKIVIKYITKQSSKITHVFYWENI